jgi:esterase
MGYVEMANDVIELLDQLMIEEVIVIGHSMGGKTAIAMAQAHPDRVTKLVVADIAPVDYGHDFSSILAGFRAVDLGSVKDRKDADSKMAADIDHPGIRQYLLQNLAREGDEWQWRVNLDGIENCMHSITGYAPGCSRPYTGDTLVIRGEHSDYVLPEHEALIYACMPGAVIETLQGVGHWVYAEDPAGFVEQLRSFIEH